MDSEAKAASEDIKEDPLHEIDLSERSPSVDDEWKDVDKFDARRPMRRHSSGAATFSSSSSPGADAIGLAQASAPPQPAQPSRTTTVLRCHLASQRLQRPQTTIKMEQDDPETWPSLDCAVHNPQKENDGTKDAYISYLISTTTTMQTFQTPSFSVRRRFTDFVFLYKHLCREYPQCAVPPLPDKHNMSYVRGDRYAPDFTHRRAQSLHRFLRRITLHPVLRTAPLLALFLESLDWYSTMKARPQRTASQAAEQASGGILDTFTDGLMNAFSTRVHKPDKRFIEVSERATKLDEDLANVEKVVARVARRQGDLEADYADLATQSQKLVNLESGVEGPLTSFAASVDATSAGLKGLKEHTDQGYLGELRDMESYITAVKALLKTREQKQQDFEALTEYLAKSATDRDILASQHGTAGLGASGFLRAKIEDVRGVDHEQSRRDRVRKLELQIDRLTREVESAKLMTETFDEQTVKEVADFERIKATEFKETLASLAERHVQFFAGTVETWERFVEGMEKEMGESATS